MKKIIMFALLALMVATTALAQKLAIGDRAPEIKAKEWIDKKPVSNSKARLIEFFFSASKPSVAGLGQADARAKKFASSLDVIIVAREPKENIAGILNVSSRSYFAILDDNNKTFVAFGVQFVPYCVLVDSKGNVAWFGNPSVLTDAIIVEAIGN